MKCKCSTASRGLKLINQKCTKSIVLPAVSLVANVLNILIFNQIFTSGDENTAVLPVYMYDFETGSSINENLISQLTVELATPILKPVISC